MNLALPMARRERWPDRLVLLLRADPETLCAWLRNWRASRVGWCLLAIIGGAGLYGAAMGGWRNAQQALYTGLKLPLVLLLTTLGNGLLNGMLAPLLGLRLDFRQTLLVILMSFAITALVLGGLAPVAAFVVWNTPPLTSVTRLSSVNYGVLQLAHVAAISLAGVLGNVRLVPLLERWSGSAVVARRVLLAWLAGNLLLGSQIAWVLRPFIWDPARPVEFIGPEYFRGSFYETVFDALLRVVIF
jgi:hypothetical protein